MGRVSTPKYRLELWDARPLRGLVQLVAGPSVESWEVGRRGRPTRANLERYIFRYADSLKAGGVNAHVSKALGFVPYPREARIVNQRTGAVVAHWKADRFQVF